MSPGMFDLLHGVSRMTEFPLIKQLGNHTRVFFQRVPAIEPETLRQTDCSIGFIDMRQRCDIEFRLCGRTAIASHGTAAECPVCNHENQRRPHDLPPRQFVQKSPAGLFFPVNLKIDRSQAALLIPHDAVIGTCQNFGILKLQLVGAVGIPEEIFQCLHVESPSGRQRTIFIYFVKNRRHMMRGIAVFIFRPAAIEQNRTVEPESHFIGDHYFHILLPPHGFD